MSSTGIDKARSRDQRIADNTIDITKQIIEDTKVFNSTSPAFALSGEQGSSEGSAAGNYLAKSGDVRLGPMGNEFRIVEVINNTISVSISTPNYVPFIILNPEGGSPDDLETIIPGESVFLNQEILLQVANQTITLKNSDNIITPDGGDLIISVGDIVRLYFSQLLSAWVVAWFSSNVGGGEFFGPWTANHDAGNFALNNVSSIQISDSVGGVHGLLQGLAGTGIRLTLTAGEKFQLFDNITNILEMDNTNGLNLKQHDIFGCTGIDLDGSFATIQGIANLDFFQASHSINSLSGSMLFQVNSTDFFGFFAGGVEIARFQDIATVLSLDMKDHAIGNAKHIVFDSNATYTLPNTAVSIGYDGTANKLKYNVENLGTHNWLVNGVQEVEISSNNMTFRDGFQVIFNPDTTNPGVNVGLVVGDPSATNNGDLWYNASTNKLRTKENGVDVDVVGGGGVNLLPLSNTWTGATNTFENNVVLGSSSVDTVTFEADTVGNITPNSNGVDTLGNVAKHFDDVFTETITFRGSGGNTSASITAIYATSSFMTFNVPTGVGYIFNINGNDEFRMTSTQFDLGANDLRMEGGAVIKGGTAGIEIANGPFGWTFSGNVTNGFHVFELDSVDVMRVGFLNGPPDGVKIFDGFNLVFESTVGTKIGSASTQKLAFWGATPVSQGPPYTVTNLSIDRTYDANTVTVSELADVVGTLLADLKVQGLFA